MKHLAKETKRTRRLPWKLISILVALVVVMISQPSLQLQTAKEKILQDENIQHVRSEENDKKPERPNIVLMNMDDVGWGDLGLFGEPNMETRNIDKLAAEGMVFPNFYTSAAICSPSRASLLTGRLPIRNGFYSDNYFGRNAYTPQMIVEGIPDEEYLMSEMFKDAGYRTKIVGKWHLGHREQYLPLKHGFDEWLGAPNCHFKYDNKNWTDSGTENIYDDIEIKGGEGYSNKGPNIPVYENDKMIGRYYTDIKIESGISNYTRYLLDSTAEFIRKNNQSSAPFFLYWAPDSTHQPAYSSLKFSNKSRRDSLYGNAMLEIDNAIGIIIEFIRIHAPNTMVIFTSDNGADLNAREKAGSSGPLLCGKQTTFEGGFRTPTIFWWPEKILKGQISQRIGTQMDLMATFAELVGIKLPTDRVYDSVSLVEFLIKPKVSLKEKPKNQPVFYYRGNLLMAVRFGPHKMHLWTFVTTQDEHDKKINYCPDFFIRGVTTFKHVDHQEYPILYNINRDPGERYMISRGSFEYKLFVPILKKIVKNHKLTLKPGKPLLNMCDYGVMNWKPKGCEKLGECLNGPKSEPFKCFWPH